MNDEWRKCERTEDVLKAYGLDFQLQSVPLATIDTKAGLSNQARDKALEEGTVDQYACAMKSGSVFPAVVTHKIGSKYVPLGGNHRIAAATKAGRENVMTYIVDLGRDEMLAFIIPNALNLVEGRRLSYQECIEKAISDVTRFGSTPEEAARKFQVSETPVRLGIKSNETQARLAAKIGQVKLPKTSLGVLSSIANDNILAAVATLACKARLSGDDIRVIVRDVSEKRTELEQLAFVAETSKKYGCDTSAANNPTGNNRGTHNSKHSALKRAITQLEGQINGKRTITQFGITKESEKMQIKERIASLIEQLRRIIR